MKNPWEEIPLADYENHMKLDSVRQLQALNEMMKGQFDIYPVSSVMILGIAGGNGLEQVHHQMEEPALEQAMGEIGYCQIKTSECMLPNGKN